jgi:hypothetical protein
VLGLAECNDSAHTHQGALDAQENETRAAAISPDSITRFDPPSRGGRDDLHRAEAADTFSSGISTQNDHLKVLRDGAV